MNLFDNDKYYNKDSYDKVSYDDQKELFIRIRSWVTEASDDIRYNKDKYKKSVIKKIEQICAYACSGHIPSQDYMGYVYKRGFDEFFPMNFRRSLEWNIIAAANGSKLAPQKMKTFMNPAVEMVMMSKSWGQIIKFNELNLSNYFWFLSQYVCEILYSDLSLNPIEMSKKELVEEDLNEEGTRIFFERFRDRSVKKSIEKLVNELPEDMPKEAEDGFGEELLKDENDSDDGDMSDVNIEDI